VLAVNHQPEFAAAASSAADRAVIDGGKALALTLSIVRRGGHRFAAVRGYLGIGACGVCPALSDKARHSSGCRSKVGTLSIRRLLFRRRRTTNTPRRLWTNARLWITVGR
jgi:hypothetical protein